MSSQSRHKPLKRSPWYDAENYFIKFQFQEIFSSRDKRETGRVQLRQTNRDKCKNFSSFCFYYFL